MIKGYIFDMDGVIWDGDKPIPHAVEKVNELMRRGKKLVFLTNNSMKSRKNYHRKLGQMGIRTDVGHVLNSSYAAGVYISRKSGASRVYPMGTEDLKDEIREAGHEVVDTEADFVIVGLDTKTDYGKMAVALQNLMGGAELIACAPDTRYLENGRILPGSGAFVKALEAASEKNSTLIGKPSELIMDIAKGAMGLKPEECMVIGDKIETEIVAGKREGMKTALVLTGETNLETAQRSGIMPDYILNDLRELP